MMLRLPRWIGLLVVWLLAFFDPEKWSVWEYRATIVNDGSNSGTHTYVLTAPDGGVLILLGGRVFNGDTSTRTILAQTRNRDNDVIRDPIESVAAPGGTRLNFPTAELMGTGDGNASDGTHYVIAGGEDFLVQVASVAVSQDTNLSMQFLVSGGPAAVVLTSPTGATETETTNVIV